MRTVMNLYTWTIIDCFFVQLAQLFQFDKITFWCHYTDETSTVTCNFLVERQTRIWQDIGLFKGNGLVCVKVYNLFDRF